MFLYTEETFTYPHSRAEFCLVHLSYPVHVPRDHREFFGVHHVVEDAPCLRLLARPFLGLVSIRCRLVQLEHETSDETLHLFRHDTLPFDNHRPFRLRALDVEGSPHLGCPSDNHRRVLDASSDNRRLGFLENLRVLIEAVDHEYLLLEVFVVHIRPLHYHALPSRGTFDLLGHLLAPFLYQCRALVVVEAGLVQRIDYCGYFPFDLVED